MSGCLSLLGGARSRLMSSAMKKASGRQPKPSGIYECPVSKGILSVDDVIRRHGAILTRAFDCARSHGQEGSTNARPCANVT